MAKKPQVRVIKIPASATRGWLFRPFWVKSMSRTIELWVRRGWKHTDTTPVQHGRRTTHYLLTFTKET